MLRRKFSKSISAEGKRGVQNSLYLAMASLLTKVITFIGFIYIPNRLGVHDFGIYSIALSFVALFFVFGFGGISKVIIRESIKDKKGIKRFFNKIFNFKLILSITQLILIFITAALTYSYDTELLIIILVASNEAIFRALKSIPSAILQAKEEIKTLAKIDVTHGLVRVSGMSLLLFIVNNLLYMMIYMSIVNLLFLYIYYKSMNRLVDYDFSINLRNIGIPSKYFKQGFVFTLIGVGGMLTTKIDVVMLSFLSSIEDVGVYGLSEKIILQFEMARGMLLIAFYPIVVKYFHKNKARLQSLFYLTGAIFLSVTILAVIYANLSEKIIYLLFSDSYKMAAEITTVLCFYLVFQFSNIPFSIALQSTGLEKSILYMYPFSITINIILNYYFFNIMGVIGLAYSTLIVQGFVFLYLMILGSYKLKKEGFINVYK